MPTYQFEWETSERRTRYFQTDGEAITYGETIAEYVGEVLIMRQVSYEDNLASGYYWIVLYKEKA